MANFRTHLGVAAVGSGLLATMCLGAEIVSPHAVVLLAVAGTLGGILPDIDLDHSSPTKIMFTALGIVLAFLVVFKYVARYSIVELWLVWGFVFGAIRLVGWRIFADFTVHRGIFHSIAAGLFFWFLSTTLGYYVFEFDQLMAWILGLFVFFGYVVHLSLDELYSVDFMNTRVKRSFGTAMKVVDYRNARTSLLMAAAAAVAYLMTPSAAPLARMMLGGQAWQNILKRFWPDGTWFTM